MTGASPASACHDPRVSVDGEGAVDARVWDYWLGGRENYAADRKVGDQVRALFPAIIQVARADRRFLGRAVRHLTGRVGIRQFLDIGTGLPTAENTHEIAQRLAPDARIVYVDNDPLVLAHARALLVSAPEGMTDYVDADVHEPDAILHAAGKTLDLGRPVGLLLLGILNFVQDTEEAVAVVGRLLAALPSGSHVVVSHPTDELGGEASVAAMRFWNRHATPPITARRGDEVARLLDGVELLDPGLVSCSRWRPEPVDLVQPVVPLFGAVGRKP
ncbi:SAM-dependent methyltransferase [Streptomyces sp. SBT349]|uniref:SAM-dependent methyltransferase n=1 Tax=Streptomyces sp. SBT349 TaxID=1580539 RepID=UPI00066A7930|nr:SAM-dependent methyltransferase [Streptomyces sp. SBT349]